VRWGDGHSSSFHGGGDSIGDTAIFITLLLWFRLLLAPHIYLL
jgi:hypothetical protein